MSNAQTKRKTRSTMLKEWFPALLLLALNLNAYVQNGSLLERWQVVPLRSTTTMEDTTDSSYSVQEMMEGVPRVYTTPTDSHHYRPQGSWIGDLWIPPLQQTNQQDLDSPPRHSRFYSPQEMRDLLKDDSILFIGDSLARRSFATLYYILNSTDDRLGQDSMSNPYVTNPNHRTGPKEPCRKSNVTRLCRNMPSSTKRVADWVSKSCTSGILDYFTNPATKYLTSQYTLIVVAYGAWHQANRCFRDAERKLPLNFLQFDVNKAVHDLVTALTKQPHLQRHNLTIAIRTVGHPANPYSYIVDKTRRWNQEIVRQFQQVEPSLPVVRVLDWGSAIEPRSIEDRIHGDIPAHYGFEARMVFLQMLMHQLATTREIQHSSPRRATIL